MNFNHIFLIVAFLLISCKETSNKLSAVEIPKKPNILFILVDDLGLKDLGFTGSEYYETPNIDQLASKSTIFTHGYAGSRVCSPSRAIIKKI